MGRQLLPGVVWVDRHLHKNGGSTVREVMLRNEEAGHCQYWGYAQTHRGWAAVMKALAKEPSAGPPPALCVEAHASTASAEFMSPRLPQLLDLRRRLALRRPPVPVILTTRVREPLSYYLSFYRWRVAGMQRHGNVISLSPRKSVVNPIGSTFLGWSPPNLQSVGLLHGDVELFAGLKGGGFPGVRGPGRRPHPHWVAHHDYGPADHARLLTALGHFDVVAPLEDFDVALVLTANLTRLPALQLAEHSAVVPEAHALRPGEHLTDEAICPDMAACRAHVLRIAPWDFRLYRHVRREFAKRLRPMRPAMAESLAALRAARARGSGVCAEATGSLSPAPTTPLCCCTERVPGCFNSTGQERRWREPARCVPGPRSLQQAVAADMPRGVCCRASRRARRGEA